MRILFGANKYSGSNITLSRILPHLNKYNVRTCAYFDNNHEELHHIDWCLNPLYKKGRYGPNYFKENHGIKGPDVNYDVADQIMDDLVQWEPELVISDCEFFTAAVAKTLEIPLWICSSLFQLFAIPKIPKKNLCCYKDLFYFLKEFPEADRYLVYSPFCEISDLTDSKYEWVKPYTTKPNEFMFSKNDEDIALLKEFSNKNIDCIISGEPNYIADCLFSNKRCLISPDNNDSEQLLNAHIVENVFGLAKNIGRPVSINYIVEAISGFEPKSYKKKNDVKYLHEILE